MRKKWSDLSPGARRAIGSVAVLEGVFKAVALVDLARRPAAQVRGSKVAWATAITVVNSAGVVPLAYFLRGRRP
ncbi:DUF5652 family protein [Pedococcus bigeumensis]|uniref:Uncharacterized protein n=1 Tax=Pedococcus bigeumensis TaxID=433644 RepID=A0A502D0B4_9MICO|nr:DUF5652 family protein [Pedococcus bigeumensis]TPG17819.1 hypothetical protein EAH86_05100 [Pedococcus bigeumensis]